MTERRLYVGAPVRCAGWEVYSDRPHTDVDLVGPLDQMQGVPDGSYSILYANAVNRLDQQTQALRAMHEWWRALRPGGALVTVAVDAAAVGAALSESNDFEERMSLSRLLTQASNWTFDALAAYLTLAGFGQVRQVESPNLFADVSELKVGTRRLGLSLIAVRP